MRNSKCRKMFWKIYDKNKHMFPKTWIDEVKNNKMKVKWGSNEFGDPECFIYVGKLTLQCGIAPGNSIHLDNNFEYFYMNFESSYVVSNYGFDLDDCFYGKTCSIFGSNEVITEYWYEGLLT